MWNKIYTGVLGISIILAACLSYYSYSWLQSIGSPANVVQNYDYYANINWMFLVFSSIILLILANVVFWTTRNAWALWTTFLYFAIFILLQTLWLNQSLLDYKQANNLTNDRISLEVFSGLALCALAAAIVFSNQFVVKRMRDKLSVQPEAVSENQIEPKTNSDVLNK